MGMSLLGPQGATDEIKIDWKRIHFNVTFRRQEHVLKVEKIDMLIVEDIVEVVPDFQ